MRQLWRVVLPVLGLATFCIGTYQGFRLTHRIYGNHPVHYVYWGTVRLNSDPLNRHPIPKSLSPCETGEENCVGWEPDTIWIEPGWVEKTFVILAFPAFAVGAILIATLRRLGASEVVTFFASMPPLILLWFYLIGSIIDRWRYKRRVIGS